MAQEVPWEQWENKERPEMWIIHNLQQREQILITENAALKKRIEDMMVEVEKMKTGLETISRACDMFKAATALQNDLLKKYNLA